MTMREKMARAIHLVSEDYDYAWDKLSPGARELFLRDADAALAALEEPTEAMILSGDTNGPLADEIWRAMIGASKGEG